MSEKHTVRRSGDDRRRGTTDWQQVDALTDEELEAAAQSDSDAPPTTAAFWKDAALRLPESKQQITLRIDREVLAWYKRQGRGYQTRINAVLRAYMDAHRQNDASKHA